MIKDNAINPIKILILFISMTMLSIFLDELGFFRYLANVTLKRAKSSQIKLFIYLYLMVSILTVFTSNDVIILSFTPFICYFAKNAHINPIPYLAGEFVAANTWSMALIIGNPTNIYVSTAYGINFLDYVKVMWLPTLVCVMVALGCLLLLNHKSLREPLIGTPEDIKIEDKFLLIVGLVHLIICTIMLAIASYINIEMYLVSLIAVISYLIWIIMTSIIRHSRSGLIIKVLKRAPWQLIPFVLSMFVMILIIDYLGVTTKICDLLGNSNITIKYGLASFIASNLVNNIPMSVLFCSILAPLESSTLPSGVYSVIMGSNLGAFLTPIGALAGIMWTNILKHHDLKFSYLNFLKIGLCVALPTMLAGILILSIIL